MDTNSSHIIRLLLLGVISSALLLDFVQSSDKGKFEHQYDSRTVHTLICIITSGNGTKLETVVV